MVESKGIATPVSCSQDGFRRVIPDDSLRSGSSICANSRPSAVASSRERGLRRSRRLRGGQEADPAPISAGHSVLMAIASCSAMARRGRGCWSECADWCQSGGRSYCYNLCTELLHELAEAMPLRDWRYFTRRTSPLRR